jgi:hypothetical protein
MKVSVLHFGYVYGRFKGTLLTIRNRNKSLNGAKNVQKLISIYLTLKINFSITHIKRRSLLEEQKQFAVAYFMFSNIFL